MTDADRTPTQDTEQAEGTQTEPTTQQRVGGENEQGEGPGLLSKLASAAKHAVTAVTESTREVASSVGERVSSDNQSEAQAPEQVTPVATQQADAVLKNESPVDTTTSVSSEVVEQAEAESDEPTVVEQATDAAQSAVATVGDAAQSTAQQVKRLGARVYDMVVPASRQPEATAEAEKVETATAEAGASFEPTEETAKSGKPRRFKDVQPGMQLEGKITSIALYGVFVDVGVGRDGLVHISEMSETRIDSPTELVQIGDPVTVWVKSVDPDAWRISLTMRNPNRPKPQRERRGPRKPEVDREKLAEIKPGDTISGTVRSLAPFGAFVDIGVGKDGLVHISELSEDRVERPEDAVQAGERYEFKVLEVDPEGNRISLSLRRMLRSQRLRQLESGVVLEGTVSGLAPFGAFVDVGVGRDGLVHISELSNERVDSVEDVVKVGDKVQVKVIEADSNSKRISLTMRVDEPLPSERERPAANVAPPVPSQPMAPVVFDEEERGGGRGRGRKERARRERPEAGGRRGARTGRGRQETQYYEAAEVYTYEDPDEEESFSGDATLEDLMSKFNADKGGRRKNKRDNDANYEDEGEEDRGGRRDAIRRTLAIMDEE
jgi:small subunit ribosomal protein S1